MSDPGVELDLGDPLLAGVFFVTGDDLATLDVAARDAGLLARIAEVLAMPDGRARNWDALGDSLRDLSWLPAPGYAVLFDGAQHLRDGDEASFDTLLTLLEEASAEWATQEVPFWSFLALPEDEFEGAAP